MVSIQDLQARTEDFLTRRGPAAATLPVAVAARAVEPAPRQPFSTFNPEQMDRALELTDRFMALVNARGRDAGLEAVLDEAEKAATTDHPDLVKYALMVFVTHHPLGSQLPIPSLEERAPEKLIATTRQLAAAAPTRAPEGPTESDLDWYREDPEANAHHEHWHVVYPNRGISDGNGNFRLKDRQGELFFYMHQQMLARYDTERLAGGLDPVKPLSDYREPIPEDYDSGLEGFPPRPAGKSLADIDRRDFGQTYTVHDQELRRDRLLTAVDLGRFETRDGAGVAVTADLLGATEEATLGSISEPVWTPGGFSRRHRSSFYGNHHGMGHVFVSFITNPTLADLSGDPNPGVMWDTATAIRDPVFYRWHKHVDDISFRWQELQTPHDFSDAPRVLIRKGDIRRDQESRTITEMQSPDIILCFKESITGSGDPGFNGQWYGQQTFGGDNWDEGFLSGGVATDELHTRMLERRIQLDENRFTIPYLDQKEFFYFLRVENLLNRRRDVTVRIFLAAKEVADDRRMWIEMDKFKHTLEEAERAVIFRDAASSSVILKPAEKPPRPVSKPGEDAGKDYCNCGWPYNLLIPRGTREGMPFRLMVTVTDWELDQVAEDAKCGSMSFCGAKDRYPDRRGMGYPFDRPFPGDLPISETIAAPYHVNMAARDIRIRWIDPANDG